MPTERKSRTPGRPEDPAKLEEQLQGGLEDGVPGGDPASVTATAASGGPKPGDEGLDRVDRVRRRAYELWEREGQPHGAHEAHWYEATRQIDGEDQASGAAGRAPAGPSTKDPAEGSREVADSNLAQAERDAAPQFVRTRRGSRNSGMVSAEPRVISGDESGDATFPLKQGTRKR